MNETNKYKKIYSHMIVEICKEEDVRIFKNTINMLRAIRKNCSDEIYKDCKIKQHNWLRSTFNLPNYVFSFAPFNDESIEIKLILYPVRPEKDFYYVGFDSDGDRMYPYIKVESE